MYSAALVFRQTTSLGSLVINATARRRKKPKTAPLRIPDKRMVAMSRWYVLMRTGVRGGSVRQRTRVVVVGAALPEDEISKIQVLETWLGGKAVYHAS